MTIEDTNAVLLHHPFLSDLDSALIERLAECATSCTLEPGQYLWLQGQPADKLYLIVGGQVSLEIHLPQLGPQRIDTVGAGDALGFPGLEASYRWRFDARATTHVQAIALDGQGLRDRMEDDHLFGYQMLKRYLPVLWRRLDAARLKLLHLEATTAR